jgi:dCTP deaminase
MAVLARDAIWEYLQKPANQLVVTPLLEAGQVGASSIDVRLGHQFIILRRPSVTHIDPTDAAGLNTQLHQTQQRIRVSVREPFIIHPGQLVLAATLEYVSMPTDLAATVEGRSSWGRLGLIIATASSVAPGFKGCITLELVNDGEVPLVLYPGIRIAQLIFHKTEEKGDYRGKPQVGGTIAEPAKYDCPTGPQFSRIHQDNEMKHWGKQNR